MAHHFVTSSDIPADGERLERAQAARVRLAAGGTAVLLGLVSFYLLFWAPEAVRGAYAYSWLFAFFYFFTLAAGGCFWVLLHNVSNSGWGTSLRRVMENLGSVYPWMLAYALPLACPIVQQSLYEWMNEHRAAAAHLAPGASLAEALRDANPLLHSKSWYLNLPFWYARFACYFAGLGLVIWWLRRLSTDQDADPNPGARRLLVASRHSTWPLVVFAVTITFASFDWVMGLDYAWFSTIWGVYVFSGAALASMAVVVLAVNWLRGLGHLQRVVSGEHYHIMGKLLFAFTVFWAYIAFSQFFLIWYANIPEETRWFLVRNTEGWNTGNVVLVFAHFVVPFVVLLQQWLKRRPLLIGIVAGYLLVVHALDVYLMIIPERGITLTAGADYIIRRAYWGDLLALLAVGAGFLWFFLRALERHALYPHRDPRILESANITN